MGAIECRGMGRRFGATCALAPVQFVLQDGQSLLVTGPSGSGKTTLLRILAGLLEPSVGQVLEDDRVVSCPGSVVPPARRHVGMLFQGLGLWPHLSVMRNVEFAIPGDFSGGGKAVRRRRAHELLEQVGMESKARKLPGELSGGERQRVAWARAMAGEPRLLLLDEPLTSLDKALAQEVQRRILVSARAPGRILVLATHDLEPFLDLGASLLELSPEGARWHPNAASSTSFS